MAENRKPELAYRLLRAYVRFYHDNIYYKKTYVVGFENVPENGVPLLIASDHQNGVNDPLGIVMSFHDRKPYIMARADVFGLHPLVNKLLRRIGLLPAFRLNFDGEEALGKNADSFRVSEKVLLDGGTLAMYPESGHQDKHWLGYFSKGYTKLAFEAAEMGNFEKEIYIIPSCNHYDNYFGLRHRMLVRYGEPLALSPYYELYKTRPRTAQRQVNDIIHDRIHSLMLSIDDLENYDQIDFLRTAEYGKNYALYCGANPRNLPQRLEADKKFVAALEQAKENDPAEVQGIYDETAKLMESMKAIGMKDRHFVRRTSPLTVALKLLAAVVLLPVALFSIWPGGIIYWVAKYFADYKMKDRMMEGTFLICLAALVWIPLFGVLTLVLAGIFINWWIAVVWVLLFPGIFLFAWAYSRLGKNLLIDLRFLSHAGKARGLKEMRRDIYDRLDKILKTNK